MKIFEITDKFKVLQSSPQGIKLASQNGTEISLPNASGLAPDPQNPKAATLDLSKMVTTNQPMGQSEPGATAPQAATGQQVATAQPGTPAQEPAAGTPAQAPAAGTPAQAPAAGQQLPQVGSEVELADTIGSTMQTEKFNNKDLIDSGENADIGGPNAGDKTDDFINDVVDHEWEKTAGRSSRNVIQPEPVRESAELIAMLTIAGLR